MLTGESGPCSVVAVVVANFFGHHSLKERYYSFKAQNTYYFAVHEEHPETGATSFGAVLENLIASVRCLNLRYLI